MKMFNKLFKKFDEHKDFLRWCFRHEARLIDAYLYPDHMNILYKLLLERPAHANVFHKGTTPFVEHKEYINSRPYHALYMIDVEGEAVGSVYLTNKDEIGIFIFKRYQGCGLAKRVIRTLMELHPRSTYLANISPSNKPSICLFKHLGFKIKQHTYQLEVNGGD